MKKLLHIYCLIFLLLSLSVSVYANDIYLDMSTDEWLHEYSQTDRSTPTRVAEMPENLLNFIYDYKADAGFRVRDKNDFLQLLNYHIHSRFNEMKIVIDDISVLTYSELRNYCNAYIDEKHRDADGWYLSTSSIGSEDYYITSLIRERCMYKPCTMGYPRTYCTIYLGYSNDDSSKELTQNISDVNVNGVLKTPDDISKLGEIMHNLNLERLVVKYEGPEITELPETQSFLYRYISNQIAINVISPTNSEYNYYTYYFLKGYAKDAMYMIQGLYAYCEQIGNDKYICIRPYDYSGDNYITDCHPQEFKNTMEDFLSDCTFTDEMTDLEKFLAISNAVSSKITYDSDYFNEWGPQIAMKQRRAVCTGYSEVMQALCLYKSIPCYMVTGRLHNIAHAWNTVQLDGYWYAVEPQCYGFFTQKNIYYVQDTICDYPEFTYCDINSMQSRPGGVIFPEYSSDFELNEYPTDTGIANYQVGGTTALLDTKSKKIIELSSYDTIVSVPSTINGIPVYGFSDNADVFLPLAEELTIPKGIISLNEETFMNMKRLKKVVLNCDITTIPKNAFSGCSQLTDINIPGTVTNIGESAFSCCINLEQLTLSNVSEISANAFEKCYELTSINLPDNLEVIGDNAFLDCQSLISVTIPYNVNVIGAGAFKNCGSLSNVDFLSDVFIPQDAFSNTPYYDNYANKGNYYLFGKSTAYIANNYNDIYIESGVKYIGVLNGTIPYKGSIESITIPDTVECIDDVVFTFNLNFIVDSGNNYFAVYSNILFSKDLSKLYFVPSSTTSLFVPLTVKEFEGNTFYNATSLNNIVFAGDAPLCDKDEFLNCNKLQSITYTAGKVGFLNAPYSNYTRNVNSNYEPHTLVQINGNTLNISADKYPAAPIIVVKGIVNNIMYVKVITSASASLTLPDGITDIKVLTLENINSMKPLTNFEYINFH